MTSYALPNRPITDGEREIILSGYSVQVAPGCYIGSVDPGLTQYAMFPPLNGESVELQFSDIPSTSDSSYRLQCASSGNLAVTFEHRGTLLSYTEGIPIWVICNNPDLSIPLPRRLRKSNKPKSAYSKVSSRILQTIPERPFIGSGRLYSPAKSSADLQLTLRSPNPSDTTTTPQPEIECPPQSTPQRPKSLELSPTSHDI
jgi:hypothetical protein